MDVARSAPQARIWAVSHSGYKVIINVVSGLDGGIPLNQNPSLLIRPNRFCFPVLVKFCNSSVGLTRLKLKGFSD